MPRTWSLAATSAPRACCVSYEEEDTCRAPGLWRQRRRRGRAVCHMRRRIHAAHLVFGCKVVADGEERGNGLGSSLPGCHVQVRCSFILKVGLIERRQLLDERGQMLVLEVNDLADGLLVVGILVEPVASAAVVDTQQQSLSLG
jgi:hypothetical protein